MTYSNPRKVYFLRHAHTVTTYNGYTCGSEGSLSTFGIQQAANIVDELGTLGIQRILCSPYERALHTIAPFVNKSGLPMQVLACLAEGQLVLNDEIELEEPCYVETSTGYHQPCQNETKGQFLSRTKHVMDAIAAQDATTLLVVSHGHMIREMLNNLLALRTRLRFPHDNCGLSCIASGEYMTVRFINRILGSKPPRHNQELD